MPKSKNCYALPGTSSPEEAANAIAKAQAYMRQHGISENDAELFDIQEAASAGAPVMPVHRRVICTSCVTWSVKAFGVECTYPANTGLLVHSNVTCVFMALTAARKSRLTRLMCFPVR
ncbi:DUF2786 domain-containing protein [Escherichia coli]